MFSVFTHKNADGLVTYHQDDLADGKISPDSTTTWLYPPGD